MNDLEDLLITEITPTKFNVWDGAKYETTPKVISSLSGLVSYVHKHYHTKEYAYLLNTTNDTFKEFWKRYDEYANANP